MEPRKKINEITTSGGFLSFFKNHILGGLSEEHIDFDDLDRPLYELLSNTYVHGVDGGIELENHEILELNDNGMTFVCSGDLESPKKYEVIFDGKTLHAILIEEVPEMADGIKDDEVLKIIGFSLQH